MVHPKRHSKDKFVINNGDILPSPQNIEEFNNTVLNWHAKNNRLYPWRVEGSTLFEKIIAEILLQRTRADTVATFFLIFISHFPTWYDLAYAEENELHQFLFPFGLWKQKAKLIKKLACEIVKRNGTFPDNYQDIRDLPGVGQYIANAIALFDFGEPHPLIDVNMTRVLERYFGSRKLIDIRDDPYIQNLARMVIVQSDDYIKINFAILDFAALICKKLPCCNTCPLRKGCKYLVPLTL